LPFKIFSFMVDLFCYLEYYFYIVAVWDYSGNFLYAEPLSERLGQEKKKND